MAEITLFDIDLEEYRSKIEQLRSELSNLTQDTEEYDKKQQELAQTTSELGNAISSANPAMNDLKQALKGLKEDWADANTEAQRGAIATQIGVIEGQMKNMNQQLKNTSQDASAAEGSYNALVNQMRELQQQAKATGDVSERIQLSEKIKEINEQLKGMDAEMGNYQRNVGNYASAFTDALGKMGISLGGVEKGFKLASAASIGFKGALDILKSHPIIAAVTLLIGLFIKLKDAISKNEESSKKWSKAMAAFKPIINAITNAIDWLAGVLADVVLWISQAIPKVLSWVGGFAKSWFNILGGIVDAVTFIPRKIGDAMKAVVNIVTAAMKKVGEVIDSVLNSVGVDSHIASSIQNIGGFIDGVIGKYTSFLNGAGDAIRKFGGTVDGFMKGIGSSMQAAQKMETKRQKLEESIRNDQIKTAESEKKQNDLRLKAAKATGEERLKYEKELQKEIIANGDRRAKLAKDQYELALAYSKLTPNSKEDNDRLASLKAAAVKAEAETIGAQVRVQQKITKGEQALTKAVKAEAEKRAKSAVDAEKAKTDAQKKAEKERLDAMKAYIKQQDALISESNTDVQNTLGGIKENQDFLKEVGKLTYEQLKSDEEKRHDITVKGVNDELKLQRDKLKELEKYGELSALERMSVEQRIASLEVSLFKENIINQTNLNKIWLDERKKTYEQDVKNKTAAYKETSTGNKQKYNEGILSLTEQFQQGAITYKQYKDQIAQLQELYNQQEKDQEIIHLEEMLALKKKYLDDVLAQYGESSEIYLQAKAEYDAQELELENKKIDNSTQRAKASAEATNKNQEEYRKQVDTQLKSTLTAARAISDLTNTITDAWKATVQAQLDAGKITEEEAEEQFEAIKKMEIASAIVNTIAGAIGAFMQDKKAYPAPYNYIIGAADAAATLAAGYAQIQQIRNTTIGSSGSGGSNNLVVANATPLLNEAQDVNNLTSLNINGDSGTDQRVYILQSDIVDTTNQNKVRIEQSTF